MGSLAETYNDAAFFLYIRMERRGKGHMLFIGGLTGLLGYQVILRSINVVVFDR